MNPVLRGLVLRPARRSPLKLAISVAGVAIGVASVAAIHRANRSVTDSFRRAADAVAGGSRLTVTGVEGVPESAASGLRWLWNIGSFAPAIDRFAVAADGTDEPVEVLGVDVTSEGPVRQYRLAAPARGEGLEGLFRADAALAPIPLARRHRLALGDRFALYANGRRREVTIVGLLEPIGPARASSGQILVVGLRTAQQLFGIPGRVDRIDVSLPDSASPAAIARRIRETLAPGLRVDAPRDAAETADKMVRAFRLNLAALGSIALLVGMFLIYNTLSISVLRRRPDIGTARALGASRGMIFRAFLVEGAAIGAAGTVAGEILGAGLSRAALSAVGGTVGDIYRPAAVVSLSTSLEPFLAAAAVGLAASLFSSLAPAIEAARTNPADTMRPGSIEGRRRRFALRLSVAGAAAAAAAPLLCLLPPLRGFPVFGFAAVAAVIAALALVSPGFVRGAERALRCPAGQIFRAPGRLGSAFFAGNSSRNAVAVAAMALALGMTAAMAVMIASLRSTVRTWVGQSASADLFLKSATGARRGIIGTIPGEAIPFLKAIPGVSEVDPFRALDVQDSRGRPFTIGAGNFGAASRLESLPLLSGGNPRAVLESARRRGEVLVSEPFSTRFGKKTGDVVSVPTPRGARSFRIAGVYADYSNDRGTVLLDRGLFLSLFSDPDVSTIAVTASPGVAPEALESRILRSCRGRFAFTILTTRTLRREVLRIFDRTFAITYGLEGIALTVAVLGVVNSLFSLILERRRELAILRILGASGAQIRRAITIEAGFVGLSSLTLSAAASTAFAAILILVINRQSFGWTIRTDVPWGELALAFSAVFAATIAAALGPSRIAERVDPAEAIREE